MDFLPISPLSQFLHTNYSATEQDISTITNVLCKPLETLAQLNIELERIDRERHAIKNFIDAHNALLAPVRKVPDDTLSEIFIRCLPEDYNATRSLSEAPLLLGQVCRRWRRVSLSTPDLWTSLHIVIPTNADMNLLCSIIESRRKGVEAWLGRSGVLPLSLSIYSQHCSGYGRNVNVLGCIRRFMESITQFSSRWKKVELRLSDECFGIFRESMGSAWDGESLPLLDVVKLDLVDRLQVGMSEHLKRAELEFISKFGDAVKLTSMSLINTAYCTHDLRLPLSSLSKLDINPAGQLHLTNDEALQLLSQCTNVQYCRLPKVLMITRSTSTVVLPRLQNFHTRIKASSNYPPEPATSSDPNQIRYHTILDCITAPALQTLTVEFESYSTSRLLTQVPFISLLGPGHQIRQLDINMNLSTKGMLECLALSPELTDLRMRFGVNALDTCTNIVTELIPSVNADINPLCPSLRRLFIWKNRADNVVNDELLLKLARLRTNPEVVAKGIAFLEVLHARLDRHKQIADLDEQVDELRRRNIDLVLTHLEDGKDNSWLGQVQRERPSATTGDVFWAH
ncbi:hypothetical protein D9758_009978 [Tetrapyrgos nigripes]|uniref:F-box domain-containing protein n=1 Tax=Tetrapyrgos nigripes TaxID=182062 RepID=A0A8H5FRK3_9AGAR|nr:hypothetical protein D9758_009978 [Tetrapyrgos nigripes]